MKTFNKEDIFNRIKKAMEFSTDRELAEFLGVSKSTLSNWIKRNSMDFELVFSKCEQLSKDWLLSGTGERQIASVNTISEPAKSYVLAKNATTIPLVDVLAIGGFGNANFAIHKRDVKDYYVIPKFNDRKIDFMIEVSGSSMYPKYNSGDVVACRIIKESNFIQWNKVHVIATKEQGILIKRLKKSDEPDCLLAISDNKDYEPFDVPKNEIEGIAIVVGVVRLE